MEARDSQSKIRPLPIDEIDGRAPSPHRAQPPRRWLPLAVIVLGAIAFAIVARGLGPARSPEVSAATTTTAAPAAPDPTTTTLPSAPPPETLVQMLPFARDGLDLVAIDGSARIGNWAPDSASPSYHAMVDQPIGAVFNATGSRVAINTNGGAGSIVIDTVETGQRIILSEGIAQWGGVWHPSDPDLFAWTVAPDAAAGDLTYLRVANISAYGGETLEPQREIELPAGQHALLAWGDWGFVTEHWTPENGPVVTLWDADGLNPLELEGDFFGATPAGLVLMAAVEDSGYVPYLVELDRSLAWLVGLDIGAYNFHITSDGEWVIALTLQADGHTSVLARTIRSRAVRLTSIAEVGRFVTFAVDDRYVVLQEGDSGDLVFKDWNNGGEYWIPVDGGESIADVHL